MSQTEIDHFAEATGNRAPIHVDPEYAKHTPYGRTIAFGMQIQAMTTMLLSDIWELRVTGGVDVGSNKVRHLAPVVAGARVRLGAVIAAAEEVASGSAQRLTSHSKSTTTSGRRASHRSSTSTGSATMQQGSDRCSSISDAPLRAPIFCSRAVGRATPAYVDTPP